MRPPKPAVRPVDGEIDEAFLSFLERAHARVAQLNPELPTTLSKAVAVLLKAGLEQRDIAKFLHVSRTTVGRWAGSHNLPRHTDFRISMIAKCQALLSKQIARVIQFTPHT